MEGIKKIDFINGITQEHELGIDVTKTMDMMNSLYNKFGDLAKSEYELWESVIDDPRNMGAAICRAHVQSLAFKIFDFSEAIINPVIPERLKVSIRAMRIEHIVAVACMLEGVKRTLNEEELEFLKDTISGANKEYDKNESKEA